MLIQELADAFLSANQNKYSGNTRRAYHYDLGLFNRAFPDLKVEEVTVPHLRAFLNASADLASTTLARRQATLRTCFVWAYRNDLIPSDPAGKLEPVKIPQRGQRPLTEGQVEAILGAIPTAEKRNRLFFSLLYETGMRAGEALGIHVQHVHLNNVDGGYIRVLGKGSKERVIPLIDATRSVRLLREVLKRLGTIGPLFRGDVSKGGRTSEAVDYTTMYYHFERYVAAAREKRPVAFEGEGEMVTIHRLRHTYATLKLRDGVSLPSVRKLLGHKNIQTTLRYADTDMETIKRELTEARRRRSSR